MIKVKQRGAVRVIELPACKMVSLEAAAAAMGCGQYDMYVPIRVKEA